MDGSTFGGLLVRPESEISFDNGSGPEITAKLAVSHDVLREASAVRYAAYAAHGLIDPSENGMLTDHWDAYPSTKTIVVYKNSVPVATVRVCLYAPASGIPGSDAVPAMDVFHDEIVDCYHSMPTRNREARAIEVARLARHPDLGSDDLPVFALYRMVSYLVLHFEADAVIVAVQKRHIPFYRRLGFQRRSELRPYAKLKVEGALMACVRKEGEELQQSLPVLGLVSKDDSNYYDFLAGRRVPVFGTGHSEPAAIGMIGERFVGNHSAQALLAGRRRQPYTQPVALAA